MRRLPQPGGVVLVLEHRSARLLCQACSGWPSSWRLGPSWLCLPFCPPGTDTAARTSSPARPVPQQPAASSSSDPAPAYLRQAVPATAVTPAPPGPTQPSPSAAPDPVPLSAPAAAGVSGVPSEPCFPHMPARSPTVPPPPAVVDPPSGVRLRPRHPRRHGTRRSYPNGILCDRQCDNPACTALCPREDDPRRGTRHRHHACDDCHALGW